MSGIDEGMKNMTENENCSGELMDKTLGTPFTYSHLMEKDVPILLWTRSRRINLSRRSHLETLCTPSSKKVPATPESEVKIAEKKESKMKSSMRLSFVTGL